MPQTNYAIQQVLTRLYGAATFTPPATYYLGLSSSIPTQSSASGWNFTEPAIGTNGYARISITNNGTNFIPITPEPSAGYTIQNGVAFQFAASTGSWAGGAVFTYAGLWDASSGGNLWAYGLLNPTVSVNNAGIAPSFAPGQIVITFN